MTSSPRVKANPPLSAQPERERAGVRADRASLGKANP
jgi:hypothetical protein